MQMEYLENATHRWNFKIGAVRSGKTWLDYSCLVPKRIVKHRGTGLIVLIGHTRQTLERNLLAPMRAMWGNRLVGNIHSADGTVMLFGERCHVLGAHTSAQAKKLQGAGIAYCYGDEVATWDPDVFEMLKSRLDKEESVFDGTSNPDRPDHWLKAFLDSDADIYRQQYTLEDNPFLPRPFVENLKQEYSGTVYYDRLVLGHWAAAEGAIYRQFAERPDDYLVDEDELNPEDIAFVSVGVDFGGTRSLTAFVATAVHRNYSRLTVVADHHIEGRKNEIDAQRVCAEFGVFLHALNARYPRLRCVYADSEAQYLINSLRRSVAGQGFRLSVRDCAKRPIKERIIATNTLLNTGRLKIVRHCRLLQEGLRGALWDPNKPDRRLDNFSSDIDILDAFEYSWERFIRHLSAGSTGI